VISAPAHQIFDFLADPRRHPELDGSGTVRGARGDAPARLAPGSTFGMSMHRVLPYSMVSTVIEFEEGRRIAWQTRAVGVFAEYVGGRIWRYELDPQGDGSRTLVRETWDLTHEHVRWLVRLLYVARTKRDMDATLDRVAVIVAA
jgi:hypothetical protein